MSSEVLRGRMSAADADDRLIRLSKKRFAAKDAKLLRWFPGVPSWTACLARGLATTSWSLSHTILGASLEVEA